MCRGESQKPLATPSGRAHQANSQNLISVILDLRTDAFILCEPRFHHTLSASITNIQNEGEIMIRKDLLAIALVFVHIVSFASEKSEREAIMADVKSAFQKDDFAWIEQRYAEMNKNTERLPSGVLKSARLLYGLMVATELPSNLQGSEDGIRMAQEAHWVAMEKKTERWQQIYPKSSVAAFARSDVFQDHAFFFRGRRFARDVDPAMWKPFRTYIDRAFDALASPENQITRDQAWYCAMIKNAQFRDIDPNQFAELIVEASNKYPSYYEIYFFAANKLAPKWGGSTEAFEWLANLAVSKTRKTEGMALYTRLYWSIAQSDFNDDLFTKTRADWKKMKPGFDDIVKQYPSEWNLNNYAWFACLARDRPTLELVFKQIGDNIDTTLWTRPERLNRCRNFAKGEE